MFFNIIISKSATKYHCSSTKANGIGQAHKLGKKRQRSGGTNEPTNSTPPNSHRHDNFNEHIDIPSIESLPSDTCSITNSAVQDANDDIIVTQPVSRPHSINI